MPKPTTVKRPVSIKRVRANVFSNTHAAINTTSNFTKKETIPKMTALTVNSCAAPNGKSTLTKIEATTIDFKLKPTFNKAKEGPEYSVSGPS